MQWRFRGVDPAELWRRWRRLPVPAVEPYPSRVEAVLMGFAMHAAEHERMLRDVIEAFGQSGNSGSAGWSK